MAVGHWLEAMKVWREALMYKPQANIQQPHWSHL
jgi:hypothetical protein